MNRRGFLKVVAGGATLAALGGCAVRRADGDPWVMTVRGTLAARELGVTLSHEHALANFQPWVEWVNAPRHYDREDVVRHVLPHLERIAALGCRSFVDVTAVGLGRDPVLLRRLSERSGLHILTVTGNYAAFDERFLPDYVRDESVAALAARWIRDFTDGIEGSGVRPGLIKLGFNGKSLTAVEKKLIQAAAVAHRATGLTIGAHTGMAVSAYEQLAELDAAGVHPSAWIWIHAQNEPDVSRYLEAARRGAWISLDGVSPESVALHVDRVVGLRDQALLGRVLVSQDAGWYSVGEPEGGKIRPYDTVFTQFIPALKSRGLGPAEIHTIFVANPASAFAVRARSL